MKLQELATPKKTRLITKTFESYFGSRISVERLNAGQTRQMLRKVQGLLGEHKGSMARHTSERNPTYLKLMMMEQALATRLKEMDVPVPGAQPTAGAAQPAAQVKDPKLAAALKKSAAGQTLNPDEQKLVAGAALMKAESRLRNAYRMLKESEVQQAQVVLAAQDMVDSVQGMLEDVSEMQFKELPALVDSIRNQVGTAQADQFNTDANTALQTMIQSLQGAKTQLEQALAVVTGQAQGGGIPAMPGVDGELPPPGAGDELGGDIGGEMPPPEGDVDVDIDADIEEPAAGAGLGRKRR